VTTTISLTAGTGTPSAPEAGHDRTVPDLWNGGLTTSAGTG
jgi:hypothetical protein